jgi:toxin CcdB
MAQFDYHRHGPGYLLDVQADLMEGLNIRMAIPLLPPDVAPRQAHRLNPVFVIEGAPFVLLTQYMASVPISELAPPAGSLADEYYVIKAAIDMLFDGF